VHKTIPAKKHVGVGKDVSSEVESHEAPRLASVQPLVLLNDRWNYVATDVLDAGQVDLPHPREVAARDIEQHARVKLAKRYR
jgi:hypothetical protein